MQYSICLVGEQWMERVKVRGMAILAVILTTVALPHLLRADLTNPSVHISRSQLVDRVRQATVLALQVPGTTSPNDREQLAARVRSQIDALAKELLPSELEGVDQAAIDRASNAPLLIEFSNDQYIDLAIRWHLMSIAISLAYEFKCPPLSSARQHAVEESLTPLIAGIRKSMHQHLVTQDAYFSSSEIDDAVDAFEHSLEERMTNPEINILKLPLPKGDTEKFLAEFDDRLAQSEDRVAPRLDGTIGADRKPNSVALAAEKKRIINEVISPVAMMVEKLTPDPARNVDVSPQVAPTFGDVDERLWQIELNLRRYPSTVPSAHP